MIVGQVSSTELGSGKLPNSKKGSWKAMHNLKEAAIFSLKSELEELDTKSSKYNNKISTINDRKQEINEALKQLDK